MLPDVSPPASRESPASPSGTHRLNLACRALPRASSAPSQDGLSPEKMDEQMIGFAAAVLAASPCPAAVVLDQNLTSQASASSDMYSPSATRVDVCAIAHRTLLPPPVNRTSTVDLCIRLVQSIRIL